MEFSRTEKLESQKRLILPLKAQHSLRGGYRYSKLNQYILHTFKLVTESVSGHWNRIAGDPKLMKLFTNEQILVIKNSPTFNDNKNYNSQNFLLVVQEFSEN